MKHVHFQMLAIGLPALIAYWVLMANWCTPTYRSSQYCDANDLRRKRMFAIGAGIFLGLWFLPPLVSIWLGGVL